MEGKTVNLVHELDAVVWSKEFVKMVEENPAIPLDEETMIGWFACAIMAGYDHANNKREARMSTKPAIGAIPQDVFDELNPSPNKQDLMTRIADLRAAKQRFKAAGQEPRPEWEAEIEFRYGQLQ